MKEFDERASNILENLNTLVIGDGKGGLGMAQQFIGLMRDIHDKPDGLKHRIAAIEQEQVVIKTDTKVRNAYIAGGLAVGTMMGGVIGVLIKTYVFK